MHKSSALFVSTLIYVSTLAAGAGYSDTANAQDDAEGALEEVIVTASRREEALQDVALSVSVVDVGEMIDAGKTNLADILPFVPGVSITNNGAPFNNLVYMRGINAGLSAGVVSYIDEIPFGSSTVYTNPAPLDGTLLDLDTLNVLRGPQGTLYGASALGGLLKFNTRAPSLEQWTGSVSADLSSTEGGGLNQTYRVNANGPLAADTLGLSFTAFWRDKEGYIDNVEIPKEGWDDYEYYGGSGSLRWTPTDDLEITLQGLYQNSQQEGFANIQANYADDQLLPGVGEGEPWFGDYETGQAQVNPTEYDASVLGLTIDYDFGFATLTSVTSTQDLTYSVNTDVTVPFASFADLFFPENAPHTSAVLVAEQGFDKWTQELRLTSPSNQRFEWIVGAFHTEEDGFNIQDLVITPPEPLYFANFPSEYEETSLFATGTWYFTPDFDASVGMRYSDYTNNVELIVVGPLIAPLPLNEIEDEVSNFLFNVRYRPADNVSLYGRIASGYRPGGANFVIIDPGTGEPLTNPLFDSDSLWSYEAGVKGSTADGRFGYDIAVYYIDWEDYIITVSRGGVNVAGNADQAVSRGAELALTFAPTDALTLTGTLSYVNAELADNEPDLGGADGDQLPNTPEWQYAIDAEYRFDAAGFPAYVGASVSFKGDTPVGFAGYTEDGTFFEPSAPRLDIDSYHLVDLRAGVTLGRMDLSAYVTNVLDEYAYTHFSPSFATFSTAAPTRPRTWGVVARWNFF